MRLPRTARKNVEVDVTATLPNGQPATVTGVRFALCDHGGPTAATTWLDGSFTAGTGGAPAVGSVVLTGRDATTTTNSLTLTVARAELWGLPVAPGGVVDPWFIDTIEAP